MRSANGTNSINSRSKHEMLTSEPWSNSTSVPTLAGAAIFWFLLLSRARARLSVCHSLFFFVFFFFFPHPRSRRKSGARNLKVRSIRVGGLPPPPLLCPTR
jgi:hypothetical protein